MFAVFDIGEYLMGEPFIGVKRIIAVDSSEFSYAELEVDAHCMLVAQGNVGKSSLINAIRLFFLPECSMAKQAVNFGFSDSHGEMYESETTFNHYFPSKYSFLILEYEKQLFDGPHCCQIITSANTGRMKFERLFTQLPYEQLRHLFWQQGDDPDGIGQRVDTLSKQNVYDYVQKHDKTSVLAKEPAKVASMLYESEIQATRFTLFPLKNQQPQTVNSLRALIKLLFVASSKNKKPFTDAIANIIEGSKKSTQDQLGFSISEFKDRHESLKREEEHLTLIINNQKSFQGLEKERTKFEQYLAALEQVKPAINWLQTGDANLKQELQSLAEKNGSAKNLKDQAAKSYGQVVDDLRVEKRAIKEKEKEIRNLQITINRYHQLQAEFSGQSSEFIKDALKGDLQEQQTELGVITGNISRAEALAEVENQLNALQHRHKMLTHAMENSQFSLDNQLSRAKLDWLASVNPELARANTGQLLSQSQKSAIDEFAALFTEQANYFEFFDTQIAHKEFTKANHQAQLNKVEQEISGIQKQQHKLANQQDNALHSEQSSANLKKAISLGEADLEVLEQYDYALKRFDILNAELEIANDSLAAFEKLEVSAAKAKQQADTEYQRCQNDFQAATNRINENSIFLKRLRNFSHLHSKWLALLDDNHAFSGNLQEQHIDLFETSAANLAGLQFKMISGLRQFIDLKIVEDKRDIKGDAPFWTEITACFDDIAEVYGNLQTRRGLLGKQIEEHNQTIGTKKEIIVQNYRLIKTFEKEINQAFKGLTINNVASIEFAVGINQQFETLVHEFQETNLYSDQMQSDDFYIRLVAFAERFFNADDSFTLTMDSIIESFEPKVQLANKTGKEDKKQSNSTNSLIKIKLVQLLLKRLIYHNCNTSFPIVHDEIANIDIGQFDWWLADLAQSGFNLMAAGTHSTSPELQAKIGRRHVMDALTSALPYHNERSRVYWQGAEEFTDSADNSVIADQENLV